MEELFSAIREECSAGTWSRGVELARRLAISGVSQDEDEVVCHVKLQDRVVPHTVRLYPADAEWDCDCESRAGCCEHVAAAAIALKKANRDGQALPTGLSTQGRLLYRLTRHQSELALRRVLVRADGSEVPLKGTLASAVARKTAGLDLAPTQEDLNVDRLLPQGDAPLHRDRVWQVLKILSAAPNVEFEGEKVHISTEMLRPRASVTDADNGFCVRIEPPPNIDAIIASGIVRVGGSLHRLAETQVTGLHLERLPDEKHYGLEQVLTLVTEVIPQLERRFVLSVNTDKLPEVSEGLKPRIVVEVQQRGDELSALATLVYGDPPAARIDGHKLVYLGGKIPLRNEPLEARLASRARRDLGLTPGKRVVANGSDATTLATRLDAWDGSITGIRGRLIRGAELRPLLSADRLGDLRFVSGEGGPAAEAAPEAVVRAWETGQALVPLLGGGFAPIPTRFLQAHEEALRTLLGARVDNDGPPKTHALPALAELYAALDTPPPEQLAGVIALLRQDATLPASPLPSDLTATLRPYQRVGVDWLSLMKHLGLGAILADDMGLGKTLQTLCVLEAKSLVICPTSLVYNWKAEIERFRPQLSVHIYHGKGRELDDQADVTLTSYALLRRDIESLQRVQYRCVVLDEAQSIKNPESQVAQAAFALKADFRVSLSGTPIENRLEELWSQFHFTNPGLLGGRSQFQDRFSVPIATGNQEAAEALRRKIRPFILRRNKKVVAPDLPPRSDWVDLCVLGDEERTLYDALFATTQKEVVEKLQAGGSVMHALEALLRLRQAACHPSLVPGHQAGTSSKVTRLVEQLTEAAAEGHRALVFSQWTGFLDLIEPALDEAGISYGRLDGSTRDRAGVVNEFQADDGPVVLLLSLKAGGTGLNLTAADHVFLLDLWWNPAVEQQAADRAHRIGQTRPVFVHRLVAKDTVEERILALQEKKRALADIALSDAAVAGALTRDDLLELLS